MEMSDKGGAVLKVYFILQNAFFWVRIYMRTLP